MTSLPEGHRYELMPTRVRVLVLIAVFLSGWLAATVVQKLTHTRRESRSARKASLEQSALAWKQSLEFNENRTRALEADIARIQQELDQLRTSSPPAIDTNAFLAGLFGQPTTTNEPGAVEEEVLRAVMRRHIESELATLTLRLKLTDEQVESVYDLLRRQYGPWSEASLLAAGAAVGNVASPGMAPIVDFEAGMEAILTTEQWTEYRKFQRHQQEASLRMTASMELYQLSPMLDLTSQQEDQVFQILYDEAERASEAPSAVAAEPVDWIDELWEQYEAKKAALREVLRPEQFARYEAHLNAEYESMVESESLQGTYLVSPVTSAP